MKKLILGAISLGLIMGLQGCGKRGSPVPSNCKAETFPQQYPAH